MPDYSINSILQKQGYSTTSLTPLGGGSTGQSYKAMTDSGPLFVKTGYSHSKMYEIEALGLEIIAETESIASPKVIHRCENFLALEFLEPEFPKSQYWSQFAKELALLHRTEKEHFGFETDGWIGHRLQLNDSKKTSPNWARFFIDYRIKPQLEWASRYSIDPSRLFFENAEQLLSQVKEPPTVLHGDLWSGNHLCHQQRPYLIDPAIYYGHRETDIAMCRLFGGFPEEFFKIYEREYPLAIDSDKRIIIYQLYHQLNHLNMFGASYLSSVTRSIREIENF